MLVNKQEYMYVLTMKEFICQVQVIYAGYLVKVFNKALRYLTMNSSKGFMQPKNKLFREVSRKIGSL